VTLVAAGVILVVAYDAVLHVLFTLAGLYLSYVGVTAVLWVVYEPERRRERAAADSPASPRAARRRRAVPAAAGATLLIAVLLAAVVGSGATTVAAPPAGPCNGHVELCDRTLPEVALAATHNSMSVPEPGWYSSEQDRSSAAQLEGGIRGLLIDTHYADRLPNGKLRTELGGTEPLRQTVTEDGVSDEAFEAALRLRDRLGFEGEGERGMYLCHSFCELGGTSLESVLDGVHDFLAANPGEVLVIINQDYVTPEDYVGAVRDAGLEPFAFTPPPDGRWPTLREMIDSGRRVLFLAENEAGGAPWYRLGYDALLQETPYSFPAVPDLIGDEAVASSCEPKPRDVRRAALPRQPLDHHRPGAAALRRHEGERPRPAVGPAPRMPAPSRDAPQPRRRQLRAPG
jgi:hypothetical protein